ncbi:MAG: type II secretion system F family protein [Alphaproteobacteria bacterium]|nr:type II secretion system F family protein [Alphaproteobacteria bacterium]MBL0718040.1 type II secretion system F family protein [Alphaproteobacteria bacterium]
MNNKPVDFNLIYAKTVVKFSSEKRLNIYRKLASLLDNNFTVMNALDRIYNIESHNGKKSMEPFALAVKSWQRDLERGQTFSSVINSWVPQRESLMLSVGDISKFSLALKNLIQVIEGSREITSILISATTYPLFLMLMTIGVLVMVSLYLVPPLMEAANDSIVWTGSAKIIIDLSYFFENYWFLFIIFLILSIIFIIISLPWASGNFRVLLDKMPPWSLYKIFTGVSWLLSLSVIIRAGTPLPKAMKILENQASPYLAFHLRKALRHITNGDNLGLALTRSKGHFPDDEIIGDLSIYSEMEHFEESLTQISHGYLQNSIRKMKTTASTLNSVGILMMSLAIAWVVFATFDMQNQITANFN